MEEALKIEDDFLHFLQEVKTKNQKRWDKKPTKLAHMPENRDPLQNLLKVMDQMVVVVTQQQNNKPNCHKEGQEKSPSVCLKRESSIDDIIPELNAMNRSSSGNKTWNKMKGVIERVTDLSSQPSGVQIGGLREQQQSSASSLSDNLLLLDPYSPQTETDNNLNPEDWPVKRSSSYTQVSETIGNYTSHFLQRRHSLTSIGGKCSPTEKKQTSKTPWGRMVKSIITHSRGESVKKKKKSPLVEKEEPYCGIWMGPPEKVQEQKTPRIERGSYSSRVSSASYSPRLSGDEKRLVLRPVHQSQPEDSRWSRVRRTIMGRDDDCLVEEEEATATQESMSLPNSPIRNSAVFFYDDHHLLLQDKMLASEQEKASMGSQCSSEWMNIQGEIHQNYEELQRRLSQEFHRKMQLWERERRSGRLDPPGSPCLGRNCNVSAASDLVAKSNFPPEFKRKYEQWQKIKDDHSGIKAAADNKAPSSPESREKKIRARPLQQPTIQEQDLKPEFRLKVAEWEVRKALAGNSTKNVDEIRQLMPDDFNRKLNEWEQKKQLPGATTTTPHSTPSVKTKALGEHRRKSNPSLGSPRTKSRHESGIVWLEKELHKLQREKQRLERERTKYLDREQRLEKIRNAMGKQNKKEITVKTSTGEEFKFGGISETFTRKLYEWEERKGIALESSTIALLNSNLQPEISAKNEDSPLKVEAMGLKRSRSEGSIPEAAEVGSPNGSRCKSMGGSEGNLSQCSMHSMTVIKSLDMNLNVEGGGTVDVDEVKRLQEQQCLSRNDSIRTQADIQLLDEKISLIGSLKAHREHCSQVESTLQSLEDQAISLPEIPQDMLVTIHDLKQELHSVLQFQDDTELLIPTSPTWQTYHRLCGPTRTAANPETYQSESDLSCCGEPSMKYTQSTDGSDSRRSSSHSMSRYGSESPLRSLLMTEYQGLVPTPFDILDEQERCAIIEQTSDEDINDAASPDNNQLFQPIKDDEISHPTSTTSENRFSLYRRSKQRRTSSENISTPASGRSRSSSLLSSEYIPEEMEEESPRQRFRLTSTCSCTKEYPSSGKTSTTTTSSRSSTCINPHLSSETVGSNMDRLYQLVHELKEEDLNNYKRKIAKKRQEEQKRESDNMPDKQIGEPRSNQPVNFQLDNIFVPTTKHIIKPLPQPETGYISMVVGGERVPVNSPLVERKCFDPPSPSTPTFKLILSNEPAKDSKTATRIKRQSDIVIPTSQPTSPVIKRSTSEPTANQVIADKTKSECRMPESASGELHRHLQTRSDQLRKAREEFFLGKHSKQDDKQPSPSIQPTTSSTKVTETKPTASTANVLSRLKKTTLVHWTGNKPADAQPGKTSGGFHFFASAGPFRRSMVESTHSESLQPKSPTNLSRQGSWSCPPSPTLPSKTRRRKSAHWINKLKN